MPDLLVTPIEGAAGDKASIVDVQWLGLRCRVTIDPPGTDLKVDIRTKPNSKDSSVVETVRLVGEDGKVGVLVKDEDKEGTAAVIVLLDAAGKPIAKHQTTVGGDD